MPNIWISLNLFSIPTPEIDDDQQIRSINPTMTERPIFSSFIAKEAKPIDLQ